MEFEKVSPKSYPVNLIEKDWTQRKLYYWSPAKSVPDMIHDMEVLKDDVWVVTNPKSGTTWTQELVWLLMNDCDFDAALAKDLDLRSPFLEFDSIACHDEAIALKRVQEHPSPRVIKSHLSLALLPAQLWQKKAKVVYVFRNPKDAWVSAYYHAVTVGLCYGKTLEQFIDITLQNEAVKTDPVLNAIEFYQLRNESWIFYTSYEQMKLNLQGVIEDLCKFLNRSVTELQMEKLLKHLSFEEMKNNRTTAHSWERSRLNLPDKGKEIHNFYRRGKVNGYKDELGAETIEKIDRFISKIVQDHNVTLDQLLLVD